MSAPERCGLQIPDQDWPAEPYVKAIVESETNRALRTKTEEIGMVIGNLMVTEGRIKLTRNQTVNLECGEKVDFKYTEGRRATLISFEKNPTFAKNLSNGVEDSFASEIDEKNAEHYNNLRLGYVESVGWVIPSRTTTGEWIEADARRIAYSAKLHVAAREITKLDSKEVSVA